MNRRKTQESQYRLRDAAVQLTGVMSTLQAAEVIAYSIEIIDKLIRRCTVNVVIDSGRSLHVMAHVQTIERKLN